MTQSPFAPEILLTGVVGTLSSPMVIVFGTLIGWLVPGRQGLLTAMGAFAVLAIVSLVQVFNLYVFGDWAVDPDRSVYAIQSASVGGILLIAASVPWAFAGQQARRHDLINLFGSNSALLWTRIRNAGVDK